ncbi:NAD-dependent epimerase/dehydratase family protein [Marinifilum fragile]|uniref:NAD-dependent epimerase/dehydratase family protein n=1 Tax=Marinifilum fragile TaxID=570161 RepID=UPI0006CFE154|nr:NAD-dependent epimerase/dehydratase family protein [Marinifilum fragile]
MDKVFVTGINGLLGTNLTLMLIEKGYFVTGLIRKKSNFLKPELKNLKLVEGDLFDLEKMTDAMKGCKYVVHAAAITSQRLLKLSDYYQVNVLGTENIIKACFKTEIEKLIYIGTANTYGYGSLSNPGDECKSMMAPFTKSLYVVSKKRAQQIVDNAATRLNITTISPTFMLGAYDTKPSSGKIIRMALNKRFVYYPSGGKNFVHVADVAKAIIKAFDLKMSGEKFIVANENLTYKEFYHKMILINNQKTALILIPDSLLLILGLIGDLLRLLKFKTDVSSVNTRVLTTKNYYTNEKAKRELNLNFTSVDKAISDSLNFYNQRI